MFGPSRRGAQPDGPDFTSRPLRDNRQLRQFTELRQCTKSKQRRDAMIRCMRQALLSPCPKPRARAALSVKLTWRARRRFFAASGEIRMTLREAVK